MDVSEMCVHVTRVWTIVAKLRGWNMCVNSAWRQEDGVV